MNMQVGISPKVSIPAIVLAVLGLVLVVLGAAVLEDETLRTLGYGALGSALAGFGVGYQAPPGQVDEPIDE